jgi:hypothetical protein
VVKTGGARLIREEEDTFKSLKAKNPHLKLQSIRDVCFKTYGEILPNLNAAELIAKMEYTSIPESGNTYVASWDPLEQTSCAMDITNCVFGGIDTQVGYCNGVNSFLNGFEYHKSSELNIAVTDLVLLLGHHTDIQRNRYSANHADAFYVPSGATFEIYGGTLHYGPCRVAQSGFKCIVALPRGTNLPLEAICRAQEGSEQQMLFRRNKWLLVHPSRDSQIKEGAHPGIEGANIQVQYLH